MPKTSNDSIVRTRLRNATHHYQVRLNQHPLLVGLTQPEYPLAHYRKLLSAYFHLYQPLEEQITQFLRRQSCSFNYVDRCKLPWLQKDLAFFHDVSLAPGHAPHKAMDLPEIDNVGQLIGVLYAIEGSTLGGQLISRSLAKHHGLTPNEGVRFFNGYGDRTANLWQDFIFFSDTIAGSELHSRAAEVAACQTFQLFNQVLDEYSPQQSTKQPLNP